MSKYLNPNFFKQLDLAEEKGLLLVGDFIKVEMKKNLNKSGGVSNPGESPRKQSGDLHKSIQVDKSDIKSKKIGIGSDKDYAAAQEGGTLYMQPRPYIRRAFRENKDGVLKAFEKGMK